MRGDDLAEGGGGALTGFDGGFYGGDVAANNYGYVGGADLLLADELSAVVGAAEKGKIPVGAALELRRAVKDALDERRVVGATTFGDIAVELGAGLAGNDYAGVRGSCFRTILSS